MVLDNEFQSSLARCEITKTITVLNVKLLEAELTADEFSDSIYSLLPTGVLDKTVSSTKSHEVFSITDICSSSNMDHGSEEPPIFDCIELKKTTKDVDIICYPPSMDVQGLKEDRSYIVIGGSKGLGFNTVAWMASRGTVLSTSSLE